MKKKLKYNLILSAIISVMVIFIFLASIFILDILYKNKFYPGVKITGVNLSGLTRAQAQKIFKAKIDELNRNGQTFIYQNRQATIYPIIISTTDPDLSHEIITFDLNKTLEQACSLGRAGNFFDNIWQKIKLIFVNKNLTLNFKINQEEIEKILKDNFADLERPGQNPKIEFDQDEIIITNEKMGLIFDYQEIIKKLKNNLTHLNFEPLELKLVLNKPDFTHSQTLFLRDEIEQVINLSTINIQATTTNYYGQPIRKTWPVERNEFKNWLDFGYNKILSKIYLTFNQDEVKEFLATIKPEIEQPAKEAKFKIENNRVTEFQASQLGQEIDLVATIKNLVNNIIKQKKSEAEIVIQITEPKTTTENINDFGIKSLIGIGQSNFSGSPKNRRHNIKVGAESLNGLLVKPNEEFSLNTALGKITPDKGYLPELVIKGTQTLPEYGGGLCQIGTTMFRLAINAGLEITERKPHAYRVVYYEPAGTDATIYSPYPDLKFINDTSNHLLLQTQIKNDDLIFEFWGTYDGRQVATTSPKIFNITQPGPTRYIETADLEPEKIKCLETAHSGADTEFERTIIYADGQKKQEVWQSHYQPWQAVCLVGVDSSKMATSTEKILTE